MPWQRERNGQPQSAIRIHGHFFFLPDFPDLPPLLLPPPVAGSPAFFCLPVCLGTNLATSSSNFFPEYMQKKMVTPCHWSTWNFTANKTAMYKPASLKRCFSWFLGVHFINHSTRTRPLLQVFEVVTSKSLRVTTKCRFIYLFFRLE